MRRLSHIHDMTSLSDRVILSVSIATLLTVGELQGQVIVRGTNLVELRAAHPSAGTSSWTNTGSLGGSFTEVGDASVATISAGAFGTVPVVNFDPNEAYRGMTAPPTITGGSTRSIEVWIQNPTLATEDTIVAWGHRGGPDGTNLAFNNGSNTTFGAVGHWGAADIGWNGTPAAGQLHHLAYTYDGTTVRVYADGVEKNSRAVALNTHALSTDTINLIAQNNAAGALEFISSDGMSISVLRIDTGVLSASDVLNNFNAGPLVAIPEPGCASLISMGMAGLIARRRRES